MPGKLPGFLCKFKEGEIQMKIIRHKPLFSENVLLIYNGKRKKMRLTVDLTLGAKNFLKATERLREAAEALDEQNTDQTYKELQEATKALFSLAFGRQSAKLKKVHLRGLKMKDETVSKTPLFCNGKWKKI